MFTMTQEAFSAYLASNEVKQIILDTDAYNEVDDQFCIAYCMRAADRVKILSLNAAPFLNSRSVSAADGMEKSYHEIFRVMHLVDPDASIPVYRGSDRFLPDAKTPVLSDAAQNIIRTVKESDSPVIVLAIGAISNVASALLLCPEIARHMAVIWLGGHGFGWMDNNEFNLRQDVAAARIVYGSGVPLVMLPAQTVVSPFVTTGPELDYWLRGKNALCDYLVQHTVDEANAYAKGKAWSRTIWDVTAIAWLVNDEKNFLWSKLIPTPLPGYDLQWEFPEGTPLCRYVFHVYRDNLFTDLFTALAR